MKKIDELISAIRDKKDPTVMGIDTRYEYIPDSFAKRYQTHAEAVLEFNKKIIEACADVVPAVKIQAACYEMMGIDGMKCMSETIRAAREHGYIVMVDAKRGDIGATSEAYSAAFLADGAPFQADFLTVNPYFGIDGAAPFIKDCESTGRGLFMLVKTSNRSSGEIQDVRMEDGRPLYERVADLVSKWGETTVGDNGYSSVGAVVGATYPEQGARLREMMPHTFFLVPGYGAQGATAHDIAGCFDNEGSGAIVNASRSIMLAYRKAGTEDFAAAAREEAVRMRDSICAALNERR